MKMDQHQIAHVLEEIAAILDLTGENPFKVRAYANAARIIDALGEDLEKLIRENRLIEIKGIGKNLAAHIEELAQSGRVKEYKKLRAKIPGGVFEMMNIPGLGPKKVGLLWKKLNVTTVAQLEEACHKGRIAALEGFGEKSQQKILQGIGNAKRYSSRHLYPEAETSALELFTQIKKHRDIIRAEIGGSLRRRIETIGDIDIVVSTKAPVKVMNFFASLKMVDQIIAQGATKTSVILTSGINADLRAVTDAEFPFALHYFTGSKAHNIAMRQRAISRGMKLNEYGLFKGKSEKAVACREEKDLFRALGIPFIPPELREDMGEIAAAENEKLPSLVEEKDLRGVLHAHSTYSDGKATLEAMAAVARKFGFEYLGISDHSKSASYAGGMTVEKIEKQHAEIDALNKKMRGFRILKGIECDIMPDGSLDYDNQVLARFDFVIASIHSRFNMTEDEMTKRIITAIRNPYVTILAHPTGRLLLTREPYAVDMHAVIDEAAKLGVAIEINAHPQRLDLDWRLGIYAKQKGLKSSINPDAHSTSGITAMRYGVGIARKAWFEKKDILNCLSTEKLLLSLAQRKEKAG